MNETSPLKILLHAPTAASLARARSNAMNLRQEGPQVIVRILVNSEAVAALLDEPSKELDELTLVCPNTLKKINRTAPSPLTVLPKGAVLMLASMQMEGWNYVRS